MQFTCVQVCVVAYINDGLACGFEFDKQRCTTDRNDKITSTHTGWYWHGDSHFLESLIPRIWSTHCVSELCSEGCVGV
jgi:hypothetical protein